jgi:hypothetical protein
MNPHLAALAILFLIIYLGYNFIKAWWYVHNGGGR